MTQEIRQKKRYSIVNIIFLLITLSLFAVGVIFLQPKSESKLSDDDKRLYIAKVNGVGISREAFENEVNIAKQNSFSIGADTELNIQIQNTVLTNQIANYLLFGLADSLNVKISDANLNNIIQQQKVFYQDGVFNQKKYLQLLEANGYSPEVYAETLRTDAQKTQLTDALVMTDFALPVDSEISLLQNQTRSGYYATLDTSIVDRDTIDIPEQDAIDHFNKHPAHFMRSDRVKVKYIQNRYGAALAAVKQPTDDEIKQEYNQNKGDYTSIEKREYELIRVNTKQEANRLYKGLINRRLNKQTLIDNHQLISLGWFSANSLPDFLKNLKLSRKGKISKPFLLEDGYAIVIAKNRQKPQLLPLDNVFKKVRYTLFHKRAQAIYNQKNELLKEAIKDKTLTLEDIAHKTGFEVTIPDDWQTPIEYNSIMRDAKIKELLFSEFMVHNNKATNNLSDLIETDDASDTYVIQVTDYKAAGLATFDEVKERIVGYLKDQKVKILFKDEAQKIMDKLNQDQPTDVVFSTKYSITREPNELQPSTVDMIFSLKQPISRRDKVYGIDFLPKETAIIAVLTDVKNGVDKKDISTDLVPIIIANNQRALGDYLISQANIEYIKNSE